MREALARHTSLRLEGGISAAVLVPVLFAPEGPRVLYMKRPDNLRNHSGQVSFPGGRAEPFDADAIATALREAHEEMGIDPAAVEVVGVLNDVNTVVTDFNVTPVVGALTTEPLLRPSAAEVADFFWVELAALARDDLWRMQRMVRGEQAYDMWFFDGAPHVIWGATAAMTRQFLSAIR